MNILSQSKLTLKLKSNSTLSTTNINKPEINDPLKSEFLPNNSIVSENDSFVEMLHTVQSHNDKIPMSQSIFKTSPDKNVSNLKNENKQCPVCLQMVDVKNFINHVKSCGSSHKLSSEVLIKAVDLQERQAAEREALGLPKLIKSLDVKKKKKCNIKQTKLKIGSDSNLDLAIAMSVSLQESKEAEIIKESETLIEAGLENEALEKRKTLESFGFISNQPVKSKTKETKTNSWLFKQTKEDREKRITEKVAMILIDTNTDNDASSSEILVNHCSKPKLESKYLNKIRNEDNRLWKKSLLEEKNVSEFYVKNLSKFIIPSESNDFTNSKNVFLFPENQNTSKHESNISKKEHIETSHMSLNNSNVGNISIASHEIIRNKTRLDYSFKWKSMIGNQYMSDVTVFSKDEHEIPVHTLVFYVQCPDILDDIIIEESVTCKPKKMIMWLEYSYEACLAFLEFIYSGQKSFISSEYREDYLNLATRYNILMDVINDEKHGLVSKEQDKILKRKSTEFYNSPTDCKRYKAASPDMFTSDDITTRTCSSFNFLETTVNDEKSLSTLRTKQWLNSCNGINQQQQNSSFTENLVINISPKSPTHSFHSASTVSLQLSPSNTIDYNKDPDNNDVHVNSLDVNVLLPKSSTNESSVKTVRKWHEIKCEPNTSSTPLTKISMLTNLHEEPELIIINSDSDSESINIIQSNSINISCNSNKVLNTNLLNENNEMPLFQPSTKYKNDINTIELNDNSLDSIHSDSTNMCERHDTTRSHSSLLHNSSMLDSRNKTFININDKSNVFSAVTNNLEMPVSSNNISFINLTEESSSDTISTIDLTGLLLNNNSEILTSKSSINNTKNDNQNSSELFSNVTRSRRNLSSNLINSGTKCKTNSFSNECYSRNINTITNEDFDFDLINSSNKVDSKSFECNNISLSFVNTRSYTKNNVNMSNSNEMDILGEFNSDSELLKNNSIMKTNIMLASTNYNDSHINTKYVNLIPCSSSKFPNKHTLIKPVNTQVKPTWQSKIINISSIADVTENDHDQDTSDSEQIIDDPWMDCNDWQSINLSHQNVSSPVLTDNNSIITVNESEESTPPQKNIRVVNLDLQTSLTISNNLNKISSQKKIAVTPNKYGSKINTPRSVRRVQSESFIGSKEQITPLPDYSSMKTPDLRKEFDRYGLKDLGRRKGKLILRHIYDVLHPLSTSEEAVAELEQFSDSTDGSEHGIPDYEGGSYDELETCSQTNSSNKISVEMGFKQLLTVNEDLHKKILCYEPIWIEELKEYLKQYNVNISIQKLMTFLDDKCVTFRSRSLTDQRQKTLSKKNTKRRKLF